MWFIARLFALLILASPALARGGHNTTFDPNLFGGNWTTINCTGVKATDDASFASWITAAKAANPAVTPLRLTGNCNVTDEAKFDGINNVVVWAYGATITDILIGPGGTYATWTPYFTNSANAGDTTITLKTPSDAANFAVGRYLMMGGLEVQSPDCGTPPNTQVFEYVPITAINGGVLSLGHPLVKSYSDTWPLTCSDGPAAAFSMGTVWQTNIQIYGLTIISTVANVVRGRTVQLIDVNFIRAGENSSIQPTASDTITMSGGFLSSAEFDKLIGTISLNRVTGSVYHWLVQSASINSLIIANSSVSGLFGTPLNTNITNSVFDLIEAGPNGYGAASSIIFDGVKSASGSSGFSRVAASAPTYTSGTFSLALTDPNIGSFIHAAVPGFKYVLAGDHCPNCGTPTASFTVTGVRIDGTNYYWDTNLLSQPSATCGGPPCTFYQAWGALTIKQTNTPAGGADFTQYAAP